MEVKYLRMDYTCRSNAWKLAWRIPDVHVGLMIIESRVHEEDFVPQNIPLEEGEEELQH